MVSKFKQESKCRKYRRNKPKFYSVSDAVCPVCGKHFNGKTSYNGEEHNFGRRWCSLECRRKAKIKYSKNYYFKFKDEFRKWGIKRRNEVRNSIINYYSAVCNCCGITIKDFLTIDHIDGVDKSLEPQAEYKRIINEGFPNNVQILCMNCNFAKRHFVGKKRCHIHHPEDYTEEELNGF